jgi:hypothetical protein
MKEFIVSYEEEISALREGQHADGSAKVPVTVIR